MPEGSVGGVYESGSTEVHLPLLTDTVLFIEKSGPGRSEAQKRQNIQPPYL